MNNKVYVEFYFEDNDDVSERIHSLKKYLNKLFENTFAEVHISPEKDSSGLLSVIFSFDKPVMQFNEEASAFFEKLSKVFKKYKEFYPHFTQFDEDCPNSFEDGKELK